MDATENKKADRERRRRYGRERIIYALACPTCGVFRYVGHTALTIEARYQAHRSKPVNADLAQWIADMDAIGTRPRFIELTRVKGYGQACEAEKQWIALASVVYGRSLLNRVHRGDRYDLYWFRLSSKKFYRRLEKSRRAQLRLQRA